MRAVHSEVCGLSTVTTETRFVERYITVNFVFDETFEYHLGPLEWKLKFQGQPTKPGQRKPKLSACIKT